MSPSVFGDPDFKDLAMRQKLARARHKHGCIITLSLAQSLHHVVETGPFGLGNPWESEGPVGRSTYLRLADECLRQMEWARNKHGWSTCPTCGGPPHDNLTPAPEDWRAPYSKPLGVEWLCPPCHGRTRRKDWKP